MFGSRKPSKPQKRQKRKGKPPWTDGATRVTVAGLTLVTIGHVNAPLARFWLPTSDAARVARDAEFGRARRGKVGA